MSSSDEESYPEVDELKVELLEALQKVEGAASFSCKGSIPRAPNPGIEVADLGLIGLPFSARDVESLISKCRQSPFGKGEETVVDDSVRKSWELNPSQLSLTNPEWSSCMAAVVDNVHRDLGLTCHRANVRAELYKLLIYEEGAFFKSHQDSEKTRGMFGTLVVCLPSKHGGGKVLLTHNKRNFEFASADSSKFDTTYAAWYSDVFHEVEKVTSGYRIVLTYNLVQNSSLSQKAPDPDSRNRVVKALKLWEQATAENQPGYPPYIIHKLEHYYSKQGANLNELKGRDAKQVRCLDSACRELGYDLYLAVYEKKVEKDDYAGDEEFGREEAFEYLTDLDGTEKGSGPAYRSSCRLEEYESDDEEADESEHEGYTGNEGAPATYWYRQTVVLIVPPSRKLEFLWNHNNKYSFARKALRDLRPKAVEDLAVRKQLYRLCHIVLPGGVYDNAWSSGYSRFESPEAVESLAQVGEIALEYEWVNLWARVPLEPRTTPECLDALASFIFHHGIESIKDEMTNMIKKSVNIADKYQLLQKISNAINKQFTDASDAASHKAEFDSWYVFAFTDILDTKQRATKDDGAALGEIARTCQDDVRDQIVSKLDGASTQTIAAFVLAFSRENPVLDLPAQADYLRQVFKELWQDFRYARAIQTYGATVEALNHYELADLMDLTKKYSEVSMSDVFDAMSEALAFVDDKYIGEQLFPFVESIMSHKVSSLIVEDNPELFDTVSAYIQAVVGVYIRRRVGDEPRQRTDWALPDRGCNQCVHCLKISNFMANPNERFIRYQVAGPDRKHLDCYFGRYGTDPQYDITIDTSSRPYFWVCTKDHKAYRRDHPAWKTRLQEAQQKLKSIGGKDMVYLKTYLGENFDAFMSCRTEHLQNLGLKKLTEREPLRDLDASGVNAANNRKRAFDNGTVFGIFESPDAKRPRPENPTPGPAEVIDLT